MDDFLGLEVPLQRLELPHSQTVRVLIEGQSFWVTTDSKGAPFHILKDRCAHMGTAVEKTRNGFVCRTHGWIYQADGKNAVPSNPGLEEVSFVVLDGRLLLDLPQTPKLGSGVGQLQGDETLELLSHASFLLSANKRSVLFDPWLCGPSYWGSWHLWPKNEISVESLHLTDVVITHPHPDHFHLPTLGRLSREISVHIPNFESGILQRELRKMGFEHIKLVPWEERHELAKGIELSFLRPTSQWEDSSCLVSVNGWVWLNQNDSGAALRDDLLPDSVDLLTSSFDVGASGYPLTWDISQGRSAAILRNAKTQILQSILARSKSTKSRYYAPFAGWWRHGLKEHEDFAGALPHTSFGDLREIFRGHETELIETIPSSKLILKTMTHTFDENVRASMTEVPNLVAWNPPAPTMGTGVLKEKLAAYMSDLQKLSAAAQCEPVLFTLRIKELSFEVSFKFGDPEDNVLVHIDAEIPEWVGELLVSEDSTATWNHFDIGYWVRWTRSPDIYPSNFMRLLQLGRPSGLIAKKPAISLGDVRSKSISDFLEKDPELARAILSRSGLPCAGCGKSNSDNLESAFEIHSVPRALRERAVNQLSALLANRR